MGNCLNGKYFHDIKLDIFQKKINLINEKPIKEGFKLSLSAILKIFKLKKMVSNLINKKLKKQKNHTPNMSKYLDELCSNINFFNNHNKNLKIYFFIQPNLITSKKRKTNYENQVIQSRQIEKIQFCKNFYTQLNKRTKNISNVFNLENVFDKNEDTIFIDEAHVGDKGNEIIAKKICKVVNNV